MANSKVTYSKPWIDIADQLTKLTARGLVVADNAEAERFLRYANYYRFSGFCLRFQYWDKSANDRRFIPGTKFEDVVALCKFDSKLRDCISDALEMVELSLRSKHFSMDSFRDSLRFLDTWDFSLTGKRTLCGGKSELHVGRPLRPTHDAARPPCRTRGERPRRAGRLRPCARHARTRNRRPPLQALRGESE